MTLSKGLSPEKDTDFNHSRLGRPTVVGIFGISGSGKTFVLDALRQSHGCNYLLVDGSEIISHVTKGGLDAFQALDEAQKRSMRELASQSIVADCLNDGKPAIVAGHAMLWSSQDNRAVSVWTQQDLEMYTHIIYLNLPPEVIYDRCLQDATKRRLDLSVDQLRQWQCEEEKQLRTTCYKSGIVYFAMSEQSALPKVTELVKFFLHRQQDSDEQEMDELVDRIVISRTTHPVSALVFDADKTLSAADSGHLFWEHIQHGETAEQKMDYLATIFSGPLGYTNAAFLQAALLYEELEIQKAFDCVSGKVAAQISLYPEVAALLIKLHSNDRLIAIVVTCGLRSVWVEVLRRHGLFDRIKVIGSGPLSNAPVITAQVKARVVARLQNHHHLHVVAVGDSVLDIDMFTQADRAIVVVGDERSRSRSMERELGRAIFEGRFAAHQAVLARGSSPRLTTSILPLVDLNGPAFWNGLLPNDSDALLNIIHFTDAHVSGILATPMRDAANSGPALRDAHWQTGRYLALQTLPDLLGVEEYMIQHVQGHQVVGTRIAYQDKTLIIALMRGGEPMAFGVSDVLPASPFLHARRPEDVKPEHVDAMNTVILVDSVVNSGKSIVDFICHLEALSTAVRIVIIAGVVQNGAIGTLEALQKAIHRQKIDLIALRFSNNKFTGRGGTDTGNRLYQTTRLV